MKNERPFINDTPGQPAHPMTDEQYAQYLKQQDEMSKLPPPAPDPMQERMEKQEKKLDSIEGLCNSILSLLRGGR